MERYTGIVSPKMRSILNDWLVEVHLRYRQQPETLFLCINLIDRYLTNTSIPRQKLQLLGVASLLIASKYYEAFRHEVTINDMVYICDKTYTVQEVLQMEASILSVVSFRLSGPTIFTFLSKLLKVVEASKFATQLSTYLAECCLIEYEMLKYPASQIAAACCLLAFAGIKAGAVPIVTPPPPTNSTSGSSVSAPVDDQSSAALKPSLLENKNSDSASTAAPAHAPHVLDTHQVDGNVDNEKSTVQENEFLSSTSSSVWSTACILHSGYDVPELLSIVAMIKLAINGRSRSMLHSDGTPYVLNAISKKYSGIHSRFENITQGTKDLLTQVTLS
jgi:Cyclin, N-terminal domain/Cyclin, C-terminal domain